MKQAFDEIVWTKKFFAPSANLDGQHLQPILYFSLIWNVFESLACNKFASYTNIEKSVQTAVERAKLTDVSKYLPFLNYVNQRYIIGGSLEEMFNRLQMTHLPSREVVTQAFSDPNPGVQVIVHALLLIAQRIRNNLFHGNKNIESLPDQTELFRKTNEFLATYLDDIGQSQVRF